MSFLFRYLRFHDIIGGIHVPVDDGVDKLNRKYTLLVFLFLALPIFTKQYIGDPIECFAPVYFAEHQSRYINSYCWTQSTYYMVPVGDPEDDGDQQEPPDRIMPDEVDYFIGLETVTHIGNEKLRRVRVSYYQWAPLILLVQGLCFYIPFLIWNSCANNAGVKLRRLLKKASDIASLPPGCQQREALLAEFVDQFHTLVTGEAGWCADLQCGLGGGGGGVGAGIGGNGSNLSGSSNASSGSSGPGGASNGPAGRPPRPGAHGAGDSGGDGGHSGRRGQSDRGERHNQDGGGGGGSGAGCCLVGIPIFGPLLSCCLKPCTSMALVGPSKYLCLLYLAVKTAYVLNVVLQFFLLGQFLGRGYLKHGLELINRLIVNGDWWASPRFPLSTLCQVRADMSGGLRSYTCQCVLPINVFNEKIFSVVWFYMAFLMPLNVLSLLFWIYRTFETNRLSYIRLCLWRTRLVELNQIHRTVRRLSQSYLGWDGVFLLRLIEHNHGSIMATLIMSRLWEFYANQMKLQEDANQLALATNAHQTLAQTQTALTHHPPPPHGGAAPPGVGNHHHQQQLMGPNSGVGHPSIAGAPHGGVGGGHHGHHAHHHGGPGSGGHHHPAHALPPLMPSQPQQQQQQQQQPHFAGGGGHHPHGPHPVVGQPQQQHSSFAGAGGGGGGGGQAPHGPHAHHSGQISQPGHHPPLHAANAHVAAHPRHHPGPFPAGTVSAGLLAQLQQQQQHHHPGPNQQAQLQQQQQPGQQQANQQQPPQQPASGNVAAAVAALAAAAAAAATHSSTNQTPAITGSGPSTQQQQQQQPTSTTISQTTSQQQQSSSNNNNNNQTSSANNTTKGSIHLHSLLQQQQQANNHSTQSAAVQQQASLSGQPVQQSAAAGQHTGSSTAATALPPPPPSTSSSTTTTSIVSSTNPQQQQTSFMNAPSSSAAAVATAAGSGGLQQQHPVNPPLPPPPPAHVVAAVAAAAVANLSGPLACDRSNQQQQQQKANQPAPSRTKQQQPITDNEARMKNYL